MDAGPGLVVSSDPNDPMSRAAATELLAKLGRSEEAAARRKEADELAARNAAYT